MTSFRMTFVLLVVIVFAAVPNNRIDAVRGTNTPTTICRPFTRPLSISEISSKIERNQTRIMLTSSNNLDEQRLRNGTLDAQKLSRALSRTTPLYWRIRRPQLGPFWG